MSGTVDARLGTRIAGKFLLQGRIGSGAAGVVYQAVQEPLGRTVALKILTAQDEDAARRLAREGQAIARLKHENVVVIFDLGRTDEGVAYIAMEHIPGGSVRDLFERVGRVPVADVITIARGVALALVHAHAAGVVHRDLKPENVMLMNGSADVRSVRVVDFGLARMGQVDGGSGGTASTTIQGTPAYMSPEQIEVRDGAPPGSPCDVYALGVLLYELLTGTNPFRAETPFKTLLRHVDGPVPPPPSVHGVALPIELDGLVISMLQKTAAARPSAAAVLTQLEALTHAPQAATVTAVAVAPAPSAKLPVAALALAVGLVLLAAVLWSRTGAELAVSADAGGVLPLVTAGDAGARIGPAPIATDPGEGAVGSAHTVPPDIQPGVADVAAPDVHDAGHTIQATRDSTATGRRVVRAAESVVVVDGGPAATLPVPALERRLAALRGCPDPCAVDVQARFAGAVAGDLLSFKSWKLELEACRLRCASP